MGVFKGCRKCSKGWIINEGEDTVIKCDCLEKIQKQIESEAILKRANLPISIKDYDLSKYIGPDKNGNLKKLKMYSEQFSDKFNSKHLFCQGKNSCQKTTVLSFITKEIISNGFEGQYILMNELIKILTSEGFKDGIDEEIKKYLNCDILVIDEAFDLKKLVLYQSGYQLAPIDQFLRTRLERLQKATIFISNVNISDIDQKFGLSLIELIRRNCSVLIFEDSINLLNDFNPDSIWD